ncbi:MAG: mannose-1-phosphate guanylyltransferase [Anaerolineae bacterium]|nr:mannose-1-phosphate guanylyltransferase [Anaerolineae bacterium]
MSNLYALIMAGGGGTRLWPLSRKDRPKQALPLTEERTLFQVTVERLNDLLPPDRIYVVTGKDMADMLKDSTPQIPAGNFLLEPIGRDSAPAAGLGAFHIAKRDPNAVIAILSADHHIADEAKFRDSLRCAAEYAEKGYIVTLGIDPTFPSTGFGYILRGEEIGTQGDFHVYHSEGFTEKPNAEKAASMLMSGKYSWNAGMFILKAERAVAEFQRQQPAMYETLKQIADSPDQLNALFPTIQKLSLDYAIMEGAQQVAVIPVSIGWSDVGTWSTLFDVLARDEEGNALRSTKDDHIQIDTTRTLIVSDRLVVTIGIEDLVIVDSPDAILVCRRDRAQDVKDIVERLKNRGDHRL